MGHIVLLCKIVRNISYITTGKRNRSASIWYAL